MVIDMMKEEFERLAGYEVSFEDYNKVIEPMYMATNLDKVEFVNVIDRKRFEVKHQKSEEQIQMEESLNEEIKMLKSDVEWYQGRIRMFETYLQDDDSEFWKNEIKTCKYQIKLLKNRISSLKWVLA